MKNTAHVMKRMSHGNLQCMSGCRLSKETSMSLLTDNSYVLCKELYTIKVNTPYLSSAQEFNELWRSGYKPIYTTMYGCFFLN